MKIFSVAIFAFLSIIRNATKPQLESVFHIMLVVNYGGAFTVAFTALSANALGFAGAVEGDISPW